MGWVSSTHKDMYMWQEEWGEWVNQIRTWQGSRLGGLNAWGCSRGRGVGRLITCIGA